MAEFWSKRDREKKKQQVRKEKEERRRERKEQARDGNVLSDMIAYLDENGNLTSVPPDPSKRREVKLEDIEIGVPKLEDRSPEDRFDEGIITFFNEEKGYGFIRHSQTQQSIFVHSRQLASPVKLQDRVRFVIARGLKGPEATEVSIVTKP